MKDHCTMFPICQIKNYRQQGKSIDADRVSCSSADNLIVMKKLEIKESFECEGSYFYVEPKKIKTNDGRVDYIKYFLKTIARKEKIDKIKRLNL
ncbi:MAG TPA: hypothetical protein VI911_04940 [Patescibacteria group bacterium]|nr:hypothetical protein [Patescibacteria group bacterium]